MVCLVGCTGSLQPSRDEIRHLQTLVETGSVPQFVSNDKRSRKLWDETRNVYTLRQFRPAYFAQDRIHANADAVLRTFENAQSEGLNPEDFALTELQNRRSTVDTADAKARNDFELQLTYELARYVSQLCFGRIDPQQINPEWTPTQKICDIPRLVNDALDQNTVDKLAGQLAPEVPEYQALRAALQQYRAVALEGGWQSLPVEGTDKKRAKRAAPPSSPLLATNLARLGDLNVADNEQEVSNAMLKDALRNFQLRHGLEASGVLDEKTIRAMNVPVEQRISQIEINLDRMRWIGDRLEPRHARVNIPAFHLTIHEDGQVPLEMRVIVGSKENTTPLLDGEIEHLVFSPYWNVPLSIARKELLPKIKKNPGYLRQQDLEVVRASGNKVETVDPSSINWNSIGSGYQLRQRPGTSNALGLVKFIFPNPYNVYLHDTPGDNLFDRLTRTLSHGCIRVQKPVELATYLLEDQPEWTPARIQGAMHAGKEKWVPLKTKLPIHLVYWTAWADADGKPQFREDVYGYDEVHRGLVNVNPPIRAELPGTNSAHVHVHEAGTGVVSDPSRLHGESALPYQ